MKSISVKDCPELELVFHDGERITLKFNTRAMLYTQEYSADHGGMKANNILEAIVYGAAKACNKEFSYEDAEHLTDCLDGDSYDAIMDTYQSSLTEAQKKTQMEMQKLIMKQYTEKIMK